jgi:hypothetical protein
MLSWAVPNLVASAVLVTFTVIALSGGTTDGAVYDPF